MRLQRALGSAAGTQALRQCATQRDACRRTPLHQLVHVVSVDQFSASQIEYAIADRDSNAPLTITVTMKTAKRQVLDREIGRGIVGRLEPASQRCIVRIVDVRIH